jgi:ATP-dependent DNA helicase RecG
VRQRGLQPVQAEQMVGQYVKAYGKITRKQTAELCKISSTQARDLLNRLVKKCVLEMHGIKKGAYYGGASKNMEDSK